MGLLILLENEHFSFSPRNQPGCVSRVPLDTSTQAEKCTCDISWLLVLVLLAALSDGPFRKKGCEGEQGSPPSADFCGVCLHQAPHRQARGQLWKLSGTHGALAQRLLLLGRALARRCFAARMEHMKRLLVPPGLAVGIQTWAART